MEDTGGEGSSPPYPTPNPASLSLPRNSSSPSRTVLSIHQGWLGWDPCGKGTGTRARDTGGQQVPPTQVPGAGSCQVFPTGAEKPGYISRKPGYTSRKARIYQQKAGIYQQKARIYQQKSWDAAAEKPRCSNSKVTPHQKEKEQFQRGLQVQVFLPSSQQGILEEFWDYFRARAHHGAPHSSLQAWKAQIPTGNSCEQGKAAQPGR